MKKNIKIIHFSIFFTVAVQAQQQNTVSFGGIKFLIPVNSQVYKGAYQTSTNMSITWPAGIWKSPGSSDRFALSSQSPQITIEKLAKREMDVYVLNQRTDSVIAGPGLTSNVQVLIIESKGKAYANRPIVVTAYAIKNLLNDSTYSGNYFSFDIKRGAETIKKIRTILLGAVANNEANTKPPVTAKTPTIIAEDKDIIFKKLDGTGFMAALPQYANISSNFNKVMTADYNKINIMYAVPGIRQSTARAYVYDFLSIVFKNNSFPPNRVPENGTATVTPKFSTYTYMARALTPEKKDVTYCIMASKSVSGDDYLLSMSFEMSDDKATNQQRSDWVMKLVKYFLLIQDH